MNEYTGKTILITGCAKGLGRHLAIALSQQGATIIGQYYTSSAEAKALEKKLHSKHPASKLFRANLRDEHQTKQMFKKIISQYQRIDVLINLVGNFSYKPFEKVTLEDMNDVIETNITSTFLCSKLVIEQMKRYQSGAIINFGCAGADRLTIRELTTPYYLVKTGVLMLTKIFAKTYAPYGIRVNAISPGVLESSIVKVEGIPAGRNATFDDILNAVNFILSPGSNYLNGANIEVAGGWIP